MLVRYENGRVVGSVDFVRRLRCEVRNYLATFIVSYDGRSLGSSVIRRLITIVHFRAVIHCMLRRRRTGCTGHRILNVRGAFWDIYSIPGRLVTSFMWDYDVRDCFAGSLGVVSLHLTSDSAVHLETTVFS